MTSGFICGFKRQTLVEIEQWVILLAVAAGILFHFSKDQPFPRFSRRAAYSLAGLAVLLIIASQSPRQFEEERVAALGVAVTSGAFVIIGSWWIAGTKTDVIVAPLAGVLFVGAVLSLFSMDWHDFNKSEQLTAFATASAIVLLEIYLFFRGMIVGTTAMMWSMAGLTRIERGLILGERGAIACFERAWDMDEPYINAMSHAALLKLYEHVGDQKAAELHREKFLRQGGEESVSDDWVSAIESSLRKFEGHPSEE